MKKQEPVLPDGFILGKYRIISFIAEGAMGQVYEAEHMVLNKRHAIKVIRKSLAENEEFITRFRYEARIMAALEHENIVHVTDYGHEEGHPYFVMDYVGEADKASRTLQEDLGRRDNRKTLSEDRVQNLALQICSALAYAHMFEGEGMVHRDLKPGNILLRNDPSRGERVVVTDFGLARMLTEDDRLVTRIFSGDSQIVDDGSGKKLITEEIAGTPAFMSPEQWNAGAEIGPTSDIYSLGIIIYRALTSEYPYIDSRALLGLRDEPPMRKASSFGCNPRWDAIIEKCLQLNPAHRYANAQELAEDVKHALEPAEKPKKSKLPLVSALLLLCAGSLYFGKDYIKEMIPSSSATPAIEQNQNTLATEQEVTGTSPEIIPSPEPAPAIVETQAVVIAEPEPPPPPEPIEFEVTTVLERGAVQPPMLPKSAMLRVDDNAWRKVSIPHSLELNPNESYRISLDIPGYDVKSLEPIEVKEGESAQPIRFKISPRMVEFKIISNVADAKIRRGGQIVGRANEYIIVKPYEDFELMIEADGYIKQNLFIDALDPTRPSASRHVTLQPFPSEIEINAEFPDLFAKETKIEVFLNNKSYGFHKLPFRAQNLMPQKYSVELKGADFKTVTAKEVELGPGSRNAVDFKLLYRPAQFALEVLPTNAVMTVKGEEHTERTLELLPGMYKILISAPGHKSQQVSTRLRAGELKEYKTELDPYTYIKLTLTPPNTSIYMKNKKVRGPDIHLDPGVQYELEFRASGHKTQTKSYRLTRGQILKDDVVLKKKFF